MVESRPLNTTKARRMHMSTNHTPYLGLCQWEPTDPVIREDFNADNQKIDAALSEVPLVKLKDITTEETAQQVDISMEDIDLTNYASLRVYVLYPDGEKTIYVRINNITATRYSIRGFSLNWEENTHLRALGPVADISFAFNNVYMSGGVYFGYMANMPAEQISALNFFNVSNQVLAGTRFIIWGVKK
jgi:hypothetical protein